MNDRELLELAAKAAGLTEYVYVYETVGMRELAVHGVPHCGYSDKTPAFNPLNDDGDALRLALKLGLVVHMEYVVETLVRFRTNAKYKCLVDRCPRRAIVRAAAEIGKAQLVK